MYKRSEKKTHTRGKKTMAKNKLFINNTVETFQFIIWQSTYTTYNNRTESNFLSNSIIYSLWLSYYRKYAEIYSRTFVDWYLYIAIFSDYRQFIPMLACVCIVENLPYIPKRVNYGADNKLFVVSRPELIYVKLDYIIPWCTSYFIGV